jgi:ABC-type sulfate transport system permease component
VLLVLVLVLLVLLVLVPLLLMLPPCATTRLQPEMELTSDAALGRALRLCGVVGGKMLSCSCS